jgi:hypothetical protein
MKLNPKIDVSFKKMISGIVGAAAAVSFYESLQKNTLITPGQLLTSFDTCVERLKEYSLQQLSYLNDNVCSYIDSSLGDFDDEKKQNLYAENLNKYFTFLSDKKIGNREAFAHFINNYETQAFPNLNMLVASNPDTLEDVINEFIISTGNNS